MMPDALAIVVLGFLLGMRHATDADHVIAVTTIVSRQRQIGAAAATGLLWGLGHTLTVVSVGAAIILVKLVIPDRVITGMELVVCAMLIVLGLLNIRASVNDRRLARSRIDGHVRPAVVGLVHGLAGSAAVALLVVTVVDDPRWAIAYLVVFGVGTMAGMMLITMSIASIFHLAGQGSDTMTRRIGLTCGVASIAFGLFLSYGIWTAQAVPLH
jgi:high-affinity nickel-transport protein